MIQAIAFDLDDTLLRDDRTLSQYTVDVIRKAASRGYKIIPASGRAKDSMTPFTHVLGVADFLISCNGAEMWKCTDQGEKLLKREEFTWEQAYAIADFGEKRDTYMQTYEGSMFYYSREDDYAVRYAVTSMLKGELVGDLRKYFSENHKSTSKILMMDEPEKIAAMLDEGRKQFGNIASVTCSKPYFLEFNPLDARKGKALETICASVDIPMENVIAFGDSLNDVSMLTSVGEGVCVKNARKDVLDMVKYHCGSNQEDGVAAYLDKKLFG